MGVAWANLAKFQSEDDSVIGYLRKAIKYCTPQNSDQKLSFLSLICKDNIYCYTC